MSSEELNLIKEKENIQHSSQRKPAPPPPPPKSIYHFFCKENRHLVCYLSIFEQNRELSTIYHALTKKEAKDLTEAFTKEVETYVQAYTLYYNSLPEGERGHKKAPEKTLADYNKVIQKDANKNDQNKTKSSTAGLDYADGKNNQLSEMPPLLKTDSETDRGDSVYSNEMPPRFITALESGIGDSVHSSETVAPANEKDQNMAKSITAGLGYENGQKGNLCEMSPLLESDSETDHGDSVCSYVMSPLLESDSLSDSGDSVYSYEMSPVLKTDTDIGDSVHSSETVAPAKREIELHVGHVTPQETCKFSVSPNKIVSAQNSEPRTDSVTRQRKDEHVTISDGDLHPKDAIVPVQNGAPSSRKKIASVQNSEPHIDPVTPQRKYKFATYISDGVFHPVDAIVPIQNGAPTSRRKIASAQNSEPHMDPVTPRRENKRVTISDGVLHPVEAIVPEQNGALKEDILPSERTPQTSNAYYINIPRKSTKHKYKKLSLMLYRSTRDDKKVDTGRIKN